MSVPPEPEHGLRERKKRQTYAAIQRAALELFTRAGYADTTIEDVAAAANVSPSTVFRYFRTKTDLVVTDEWDDILVELLRSEPHDQPISAAFSHALTTAFSSITDADRELLRARQALMSDVPELRLAAVEAVLGSNDMVQQLIIVRNSSRRHDTDALTFEARVFADSLVGIIAARFVSPADPLLDFEWSDLVASVAILERGFDL